MTRPATHPTPAQYADHLTGATRDTTPLTFHHPTWMDTQTAVWLFNDKVRRGLINPDDLDRARRNGVHYQPESETP